MDPHTVKLPSARDTNDREGQIVEYIVDAELKHHLSVIFLWRVRLLASLNHVNSA